MSFIADTNTKSGVYTLITNSGITDFPQENGEGVLDLYNEAISEKNPQKQPQTQTAPAHARRGLITHILERTYLACKH